MPQNANPRFIEPQKRAHSPQVLPVGSASAAGAAGLASEPKKEIISPYGRCEALPWAERSLHLAAGSSNVVPDGLNRGTACLDLVSQTADGQKAHRNQ